MDDELNTISRTETDFQQPCRSVGIDQHRQVIELQHTNRVLKRVEHVVVGNAVFSGAIEDDGIHRVKLS